MERDELKLQPTLINGQKDDLTEGLSRRSFFMAAGAAGVGGTAALLSSTSAQAQSTDWTQPGNNNGRYRASKDNRQCCRWKFGYRFLWSLRLEVYFTGGGQLFCLTPGETIPQGLGDFGIKMNFLKRLSIFVNVYAHSFRPRCHSSPCFNYGTRSDGWKILSLQISRSPDLRISTRVLHRAGMTGRMRWRNLELMLAHLTT